MSSYILDEQGNVIVRSVCEYVEYISELTEKARGSSEKFFFRGQSNKNWDIMEKPCVRDPRSPSAVDPRKQV